MTWQNRITFLFWMTLMWCGITWSTNTINNRHTYLLWEETKFTAIQSCLLARSCVNGRRIIQVSKLLAQPALLFCFCDWSNFFFSPAKEDKWSVPISEKGIAELDSFYFKLYISTWTRQGVPQMLARIPTVMMYENVIVLVAFSLIFLLLGGMTMTRLTGGDLATQKCTGGKTEQVVMLTPTKPAL